jgi:hypothetical protein
MTETGTLDRKIILGLTVAVIWFGTAKVLDSDQPAPAHAAEPATAPETPVAPVASEANSEAPAVPIGRPVEPGWTMKYEADLGSPMNIAFTELWEVDADGKERPYEGKLTLHYGDGMTEAYPIIDGEVRVEPRPAFRQKMVETKRIGVEFKGHEVVEHELKWIIMGVE